MSRGPLIRKRIVEKIKCSTPGCNEMIAWYSKSKKCKICRRLEHKRPAGLTKKPGSQGPKVEAVCFRCHKKWKCRSNQDPRWSWCNECRKIVNDRTAESWVDCDSHVPGAVGRY